MTRAASSKRTNFSLKVCVVMCVRIKLGSASVHNATQQGAQSSRGVMVAVVFWGDLSMITDQRDDLDQVSLAHKNFHQTVIE